MSRRTSLEKNPYGNPTEDFNWSYQNPTLVVNRNQTVAMVGPAPGNVLVTTINIVAAITLTLDTTGLPTNSQVALLNSSGRGPAVVKTLSGATIGGLPSQTILWGSVLRLIWNGGSYDIQS